jgi:hypothetical protein
LGRCLERVPQAKVAVIVGCASYRCHEDREMGFRTLLRQRFPHIELVEAIKGEESREATYEAALGLFKKRPDIAGIYNVTGGNQSLAQAIADSKLPRRPLFITHEVNQVTAPSIPGHTQPKASSCVRHPRCGLGSSGPDAPPTYFDPVLRSIPAFAALRPILPLFSYSFISLLCCCGLIMPAAGRSMTCSAQSHNGEL